MYMSRASKDIEPIWSHISVNGVLHILFEPPFKREYHESVPLEIIQRHEEHEQLSSRAFSYGDSFDPRFECALCHASKKKA